VCPVDKVGLGIEFIQINSMWRGNEVNSPIRADRGGITQWGGQGKVGWLRFRKIKSRGGERLDPRPCAVYLSFRPTSLQSARRRARQ